MIARIFVMRAGRSFAYGALAVVLADALAHRGFSALAIGALVSTALLAGAVGSVLTGPLARTYGSRATLAGGGITMIVAAVLLAGPWWAIVLASLLAVVSPGAQDVGPFAAIEQAALVHEPGAATRRLSWYNVTAAGAVALGSLAAAKLSYTGVLIVYGAAGALITGAAPRVRSAAIPPTTPDASAPRFGTVERLAALFALDAFAGGFVVQAFLAYWFEVRFGVHADTVGPVLFGANALAALSFLLADRLAARIGLLNTMVFTHLPSNVLLCLVPLMPTFESAAAVLLGRFALSQMDVPTRQAYTLALVPPHDRARAAGITGAVRPAAAAVAPLLTGAAFQLAALGLPFFLAGSLKIVYDLTLLATFGRAPRRR